MRIYKVPKSPKLIRKRSRTGLGLYAGENIKKGKFITLYTGKKITTKEADRVGGQYLFEINKRWTIDGKGRNNLARYINHSCLPNSETETRGHQIFIEAIKNIKEGEEITYDYGKEFFDEYIKPKGCRCVKCTK